MIRRLLPWVVVPLSAAVAVAGVSWGLRPPDLRSGIDDYLPDDGAASVLATVGGEPGFFTVEQALLRGGTAALTLTDHVYLKAGISDGDPRLSRPWLRVSVNDPAATSPTETLSYVVQPDHLGLLLYEYRGGFTAYRPELPLLSAGLLAGEETTWAGVRDDAGTPRSGTATTTVGPSDRVPGCVDSRTVFTFATGDPATDTSITTFCPRSRGGGFAGLASGTGADVVGAARTSAVPPPDAEPYVRPATAPWSRPATPQTRRTSVGLRADQVFAIDPRGAQLAWVEGGGLALSTARGDVLAGPYLNDTQSYGVYWRAHPGGTVLQTVVSGDHTIVGTDRRRVLGYDFDGTRRWQLALPDVSLHLEPTARGLLVTTADGGVRLVDVLTGAVRWTVDLGRDGRGRPAVAGDVGYLLDGDGDLHALDLATGVRRWSVSTTGADRVSLAGPVVTTYDANTSSWSGWRTSDGRRLWTRADGALVYTAGTVAGATVVSTDVGLRAYGPDGVVLWRGPVRGQVVPHGDEVAVCDLEVCEVRAATDGTVLASWDLDEPLLNPPEVVFTERGLLATLRPLRGGTIYLELR